MRGRSPFRNTSCATDAGRLCAACGTRAPAPPEALTDIRKFWDIGTDTIVFQTVQQLDGDVIFRVRRGIDLARQQVLLEVHQQACHVAMSYWRSMFELIAALITGLADRIFGSSGSQGGSPS